MVEKLIQAFGGPALVDGVILPDPCGEVLKPGLLDDGRGLMAQATGDLPLPPPEQSSRLGRILRPTGLVDRRAVLVILQPPGTGWDELAGLWISLLSPIHHTHGRDLVLPSLLMATTLSNISWPITRVLRSRRSTDYGVAKWMSSPA